MNKFKLLTIIIVTVLMIGIFNINYGIASENLEDLILTDEKIENLITRFMKAEKNNNYKVLAELLGSSEEQVKEDLQNHYKGVKYYIEERLGFIFIKFEFKDYKIIEMFPENRIAVISQMFRIYFKEGDKLRYFDEYSIFSVSINSENMLSWQSIFNNKSWYHDVK